LERGTSLSHRLDYRGSVTRQFTAADPGLLPELLADDLAGRVLGHPLRVAIDGPPCADPGRFAAALVTPLRARGRPAAVVEAETFWRDASLRLEHGRTDLHSYAHEWLDHGALSREVLEPLGPGGSGSYLPSLRDPVTNRVSRAEPVPARADAVLLIAGALLLAHGLQFDRTVHLAVGGAARARRTPADQAWTLPAFTEYDAVVRPVAIADVVIGLDDPRRPAWSATS
jgi:hypothetical protein